MHEPRPLRHPFWVPELPSTIVRRFSFAEAVNASNICAANYRPAEFESTGLQPKACSNPLGYYVQPTLTFSAPLPIQASREEWA